jgi:hypothetical protein
VAEHCRTGIGVTDAVCEHLPDMGGLIRQGEITVPGVQSPLTIYEPELG